jgi:hypothetical protein
LGLGFGLRFGLGLGLVEDLADAVTS